MHSLGLECSLDVFDDLGKVFALFDVVHCSGLAGEFFVDPGGFLLRLTVVGEKNDFDGGGARLLLELGQRLDTIHLRHLDVQQDKIGFIFFGEIEALHAGVRDADIKAGLLEFHRKNLKEILVIIDDQDGLAVGLVGRHSCNYSVSISSVKVLPLPGPSDCAQTFAPCPFMNCWAM